MADDKKGMLRHVDVLGRVVIPREVRKALHINYGDLMEFCACSNQQVIIRKYHLIREISNLADSLIRVVRLGRDCDIYVIDMEQIVCKNGEKNVTQSKLTNEVVEILQNRNQKEFADTNDFVLADGVTLKGNTLISPIISGGDLLGGVVVNANLLTDDLREVSRELTDFFSNYFNA